MNITVTIEGRTFVVDIPDLNARPILAIVEGEQFLVTPAESVLSAPRTNGQSVSAVLPTPSASMAATPVARVAAASAQSVFAPIPGVIAALSVKPGETVAAGQELCILEAMKMQNIIRAPRDGTIAAVHVAVGQHVRHHEPLMEYAPPP